MLAPARLHQIKPAGLSYSHAVAIRPAGVLPDSLSPVSGHFSHKAPAQHSLLCHRTVVLRL